MEKRTLLEMINDVAISLDYETVNNVSETPESERVANIIRNEYAKMMASLDYPHLKVATQLEGLGDVTRPNFMKVPDLISRVYSIRYDTTESGDTNSRIGGITFYEDPEEFLDLIYSRNTGDDNVEVYTTAEGVPIWTLTDTAPTFCTTFDDNILIFDAYDSAVDNTLQASKSLARGLRANAWVLANNFTPLMPVNMFPTFVSKCKVVANEQLRQVTLTTEARDAQIGLNRLSHSKRVREQKRKPNYGRKR
jgi:hypothetical protein